MKTYLFYDIETTGLNKSFDQILHFAAIRTDLNFNEIKRHDLKVKLNSDIIPSPGAMLTHRMKLSDISNGISEYDAIRKIHEWMNEPGTISVGYNTLQFDDEFLRFSFFRNLLPPYTHQYANQCCRLDIYPIVVMYYLFKNSVISWPKVDGRTSLRLEDLNNANQFVLGRSHDAMTDVEATVILAKKLITERKMWDYISEYFNKKTEQERLAEQIKTDVGLMVLGKFGFKQLFQSQVIWLGESIHYKNQILFLRLDDKDFSSATKENILELAFVVRKKLGEGGFLLPLNDRYTHHLDADRLELANSNKQWLDENPELLKYLSNYYCHYQYPEIPNVDVDASLYLNGFWTSEEDKFCRDFHASNPIEKSNMIENINNPRLSALAIRVLGRHFPDFLSVEQAKYFAKYMEKIKDDETSPIIDYKGDHRLTPNTALRKIIEARSQILEDDEQLILLQDLELFLRNRFHI